MTKSKGVGRGGLRSNPGGRPRKERPRPAPLTAAPPKAAEIDDVEALARKHTAASIESLAEIASSGGNEAARVAAAKALLERGHGAPRGAGSKGAPGKKDAAAEAAKRGAAGRFATPSAPRLVVDNK